MASSAPPPKPAGNLRDNVSRVKRPTPGGLALFVGLRGADIFLQYSLLAHHAANPLLHALGIPTLPAPLSAGVPIWPGVSALPFFAVGSWLKQGFWALFVTENEMPLGSAVGISLFNTIFNSFNSIASTVAPLLAPLMPAVAGALLGRLGVVASSLPDQDTLTPTLLLGTVMCAVVGTSG
ncbi:hypothetical protein C8A05DRAFT_19837 [Staphylotrichum tortipilum]|uniref:Uncharacterized protein n=1 Tax=Staphylotrichum tortipilum TaxID=2831512 RepID=A0AAN6MBK9_9PEZI|nr:hypothetical protein C8A05DRAFT_19837 [Staphylotrichum longicolle]